MEADILVSLCLTSSYASSSFFLIIICILIIIINIALNIYAGIIAIMGFWYLPDTIEYEKKKKSAEVVKADIPIPSPHIIPVTKTTFLQPNLSTSGACRKLHRLPLT